MPKLKEGRLAIVKRASEKKNLGKVVTLIGHADAEETMDGTILLDAWEVEAYKGYLYLDEVGGKNLESKVGVCKASDLMPLSGAEFPDDLWHPDIQKLIKR